MLSIILIFYAYVGVHQMHENTGLWQLPRVYSTFNLKVVISSCGLGLLLSITSTWKQISSHLFDRVGFVFRRFAQPLIGYYFQWTLFVQPNWISSSKDLSTTGCYLSMNPIYTSQETLLLFVNSLALMYK